MNNNIIKDRKKYIIMPIILTIMIICLSITTAIYSWDSSKQTNVSLSISESLDAYIIYEKGTDILSSSEVTITPGGNYKNGISTEITLYKSQMATQDLYGHIYLDIKDIGTTLAAESSLKWTIVSNEEVLNEGNFVGLASGNSIPLLLGTDLKTEKTTYEIYIWLDSSIKINNDISREQLSTIVRAEATDEFYKDPSGANAPQLVNGLVPVEYIEDGWYVADQTKEWYNYSNRRWANAVLVDSATLRTLIPGSKIESESILAYYVWIPRFKYKLFNSTKTMGVDSYSARTTGIKIEFESGTTSSGNMECYITSLGEEVCTEKSTGDNIMLKSSDWWYTHPAFWWDKNNDGKREENEELPGIWIGKFEISSSNPSAENGGGKTTDLEVRIVPNQYAWRNNNIANFFTVIQNMTNQGNIYGLSVETVDSHMIKNTEWGAVAYLSNSIYGRCPKNKCTEVLININSAYKTGRGNYTDSRWLKTSTTGNVTGVYDMSGGSHEYVMSNYKNFTIASSSFLAAPKLKYYDVYVNSGSVSSDTFVNGHFGDATIEVYSSYNETSNYGLSWNSDYATFPSSTSSFIKRGGYKSSGSNAGVFNYSRSSGAAAVDTSSRAMLVIIP